MIQSGDTYALPPSIATQSDLRRVSNEVESINDALTSRDIHERVDHQPGADVVLSSQLQDFVETNSLNIHDEHVRTEMIARLRQLKDSAPVIHITFASTARHEELAKVVEWIRQSVHPSAVLKVGLQPELIGGAYVRTTNKVFDMSVRSQLAKGRQIITRELEALGGTVGGAV